MNGGNCGGRVPCMMVTDEVEVRQTIVGEHVSEKKRGSDLGTDDGTNQKKKVFGETVIK